MNSANWSVLFQRYNLYDTNSSSDSSNHALLNLSSPDFIFLVKDLLDLRDESKTCLEEAGAVARRLLALPCWGAGEGKRVQKIQVEVFIQVK